MGHSGSKRSRSSASSTASRRSLSRASTLDSLSSSTNSLSREEPSAPSYEEVMGNGCHGHSKTVPPDPNPEVTNTAVRQRRRMEAAGNENLQNTWRDITGESSADAEFAQNLANEDNENVSQQTENSLEGEDIAEQRRILESIQTEREREVTEAAMNASMQQQFSELSARREGRESWRLQESVDQTEDTVDGRSPVPVPYTRDWSRMYSLQEWKSALYMTGAAIAIPFVIVGGIFYYLIKGLETVAKGARYLGNNRARGGDVTDGQQPTRRNNTNQTFNPDQNPLLLLILPIMIPIWIIQGMHKFGEGVKRQRAAVIAATPRHHTFRWPNFRFNFSPSRPSPIRGSRFRLHGPSPINFNRNRPCKCRCNECSIM